jgi:hypothetical protein
MSPKLFLHKARDAPIVAILRRSDKTNWELIKWDIRADTFTEGQWLLGKTMNGKYPLLSPDGKLFSYHYDIYHKGDWKCEGAVSLLPNFTALYFCGDHGGNWEEIGFGEDGALVFEPTRLVKKGEVELPIRKYDKNLPQVQRTYIDFEKLDSNVWVDPKGRKITTKDGILYADGKILYDTTHHMFEARKPVTYNTVKIRWIAKATEPEPTPEPKVIHTIAESVKETPRMSSIHNPVEFKKLLETRYLSELEAWLKLDSKESWKQPMIEAELKIRRLQKKIQSLEA